ncbi:hypothetical protein Angca_009186, partial [Angiostrongylus cantonensis]
RRGVLPAQVRPLVQRPPSPREAGRATPSIEPDLVGKDRYDKASKCFSYAPTKALNEAFERPKKPMVTKIERKEDEIQNVDPKEVSNAYIPPSETIRVPSQPTWDEEVEKAKQEALLDELSRLPTKSQLPQPYLMKHDDVEERPVVVEQAQRATPTPTSTIGGCRRKRHETKYGSYRTLNNDTYNSDMDDLCDPDFYLNYTPPAITQTQQKPPERSSNTAEIQRTHVGTRSVQFPRKHYYQPVQADPLDDILASTAPPSPVLSVDIRDRDTHRLRNCKSIAALTGPTRYYLRVEHVIGNSTAQDFSDRRLFSEQYDAVSQAKDPDDWLTHKLRKVRSKRDLDSDQIRRRTQEKMLLEELKNVHDNKQSQRSLSNDAVQTIEDVASSDPLTEYRREEERLKNTNSLIEEMPKFQSCNYRSHNGIHEPDLHDFSNLGSIVQNNMAYSTKFEKNIPNGHLPSRRDTRVASLNHHEPRPDSHISIQRRQSFSTERPPFQYADAAIQRNNNEPLKYISGQERVAAAIYRAETPHRELYSSGTLYRADTPNRYFPENSTFAQRSETPAFPIMRETPLPFHPLLYGQNGASRQDLNHYNSMNYRSASPRSQYAGQMSRRSSLMSVGSLTFYYILTWMAYLNWLCGLGMLSIFSEFCGSNLCDSLELRETVVLRLDSSHDKSDVSLASSESSGCSSQRSSVLRSPANIEETPILHGTESPTSAELTKAQPSNECNASTMSLNEEVFNSQLLKKSISDTSEIIHHHPVFVKDTSKYWYKPTISREQAINMLREKPPGTFVVRDSNSFPGAFGLALKVATPPPGVAPGDGTELVRHFLIEPSPKGVKLKGCNNEPVFGSLSALVYQHSITPLALPTKLLLPEYDPATTPEHISATQALLEQGAACNVAYIGSMDCESLTGSECVRRAVARTVEDTQRGITRPVSVHFKVSSQGVTLTDNTRKVFFRRHFPVNSVIFAGMDPSDRKFDNNIVIGFHEACMRSARIFAIVARKPSSVENACHVFSELEPEQPATAVVNFINKVLFASR